LKAPLKGFLVLLDKWMSLPCKLFSYYTLVKKSFLWLSLGLVAILRELLFSPPKFLFTSLTFLDHFKGQNYPHWLFPYTPTLLLLFSLSIICFSFSFSICFTPYLLVRLFYPFFASTVLFLCLLSLCKRCIFCVFVQWKCDFIVYCHTAELHFHWMSDKSAQQKYISIIHFY